VSVKTERLLRSGAELHLAGSGVHLVDIYRCANTFLMAVTIKVFLVEPEERATTLEDIGRQVEAFRSSRAGPKRERHAVAVRAVEQLGELAEGAP
jgi:hypothetical protein